MIYNKYFDPDRGLFKRKLDDYQYFSRADIPKTVSWIEGTFLNHSDFSIGKIFFFLFLKKTVKSTNATLKSLPKIFRVKVPENNSSSK